MVDYTVYDQKCTFIKGKKKYKDLFGKFIHLNIERSFTR